MVHRVARFGLGRACARTTCSFVPHRRPLARRKWPRPSARAPRRRLRRRAARRSSRPASLRSKGTRVDPRIRPRRRASRRALDVTQRARTRRPGHRLHERRREHAHRHDRKRAIPRVWRNSAFDRLPSRNARSDTRPLPRRPRARTRPCRSGRVRPTRFRQGRAHVRLRNVRRDGLGRRHTHASAGRHRTRGARHVLLVDDPRTRGRRREKKPHARGLLRAPNFCDGAFARRLHRRRPLPPRALAVRGGPRGRQYPERMSVRAPTSNSCTARVTSAAAE